METMYIKHTTNKHVADVGTNETLIYHTIMRNIHTDTYNNISHPRKPSKHKSHDTVLDGCSTNLTGCLEKNLKSTELG